MKASKWTTNQQQKSSQSQLKVLGMQSLAASVLIILGAWWLLASQMDNALILPSPVAVVIKMAELSVSPDFWSVILGSLRHVLLGFGLAFLLGVGCGVLSGFFMPASFFIYPWIQLLRAMPVMSIILYLLLFVETEYVSVWVSFFIVFPLIYTNVLEGFKSIDPKLLEMAKLYEVPWRTQLKDIYAPSLFPYLMAASLTGMGLNIKAVITAETMALPEFSIGTALLSARNYLDTEGILAWTLWIIILAIVFDVILLAIQWGVTEGRRAYVVHRRSA